MTSLLCVSCVGTEKGLNLLFIMQHTVKIGQTPSSPFRQLTSDDVVNGYDSKWFERQMALFLVGWWQNIVAWSALTCT